MNQTFSFQRLGLLIASHWAENKKRYALSILATIGLMLLWFVFVMMTDHHLPLADGLQDATYYFSLFLLGPFYASQFYRNLTSKSKGINYLMVPASTLEKTVCGILYSVIFFFVVFTLTFYLVDSVAIMLGNTLHPSYNTPQDGIIPKASLTNVFAVNDNGRFSVSKVLLLVFLFIQSLALLGSVYFGQYSYIKTAITICLLFLFVFLIESLFFSKMMPRGSFNFDTGVYVFYESDDRGKMVRLSGWVSSMLSFLMQYAFAPVFWITTYFRLKEKEI